MERVVACCALQRKEVADGYRSVLQNRCGVDCQRRPMIGVEKSCRMVDDCVTDHLSSAREVDVVVDVKMEGVVDELVDPKLCPWCIVPEVPHPNVHSCLFFDAGMMDGTDLVSERGLKRVSAQEAVLLAVGMIEKVLESSAVWSCRTDSALLAAA